MKVIWLDEASEKLTARLAESDKFFETAQSFVESLKKKLNHAAPEKVETDRVIAEARGTSEQGPLLLNAARVG